DFIYEELPRDIPQLTRFAHLSEREGCFLFAEHCWKKVIENQPDNLQAKLMYALMPRGYGDVEASERRFANVLKWQREQKLLNRTTVIQHLIDKHGYKTYLEIGVERGLNFFQIRAPLKMAVDPNFQIPGGYKNSKGERFYSITSDEFFENPPQELTDLGLDIVFIDGLHTYEQSLSDVKNALRYLNPNGVIVMHDCLPDSPACAAPTLEEAKKHPDFKGFWTGEVYKTILHLRATSSDLFVAVINTDWGVGIVKRGKPENMLDLSLEKIRSMTFEEFVKDKERLLNLKPASWFWSFLEDAL
ncbi:MAG: class I SAM-dependent methyltransferase, partial [Aquificaceae bacterium]